MESSTLIKEMEREKVRNEMGRENVRNEMGREKKWFISFLGELCRLWERKRNGERKGEK